MSRNVVNEKSYFIIYQDREGLIKYFNQININRYMILNDKLAVIYVPNNFNSNILNENDSVAWWEESFAMSSLIEITNDLNSGESILTSTDLSYVLQNPYNKIDGEGILVAVIDSGIDYLNPDFIREDGSSKIISLWDQESNIKTPPKNMIFGSEFTREDINKAIAENDTTLSVDNIGTGTMISGIIASSGNLNNNYRGVAPNVDLVVVKLREYIGTYHEGRVNYNVSDFLAAISYVLDVFKNVGKPIVINLSIGAISSAKLLTILLDTFDETIESGVVMVSGAGNEGNTDIHYEGTINNENEYIDVIVQVADDNALNIQLSMEGPDRVSAMLISPGGELSQIISYTPDNSVYNGRFNLENTDYNARLIYPWLFSGRQLLEINLFDIKPGIWTIRIMPEFILTGVFDIYLPNKNLISQNTRFINSSSFITITKYGLSENIITVGTYNNLTNSMWIGSSKGPSRGITIKPDIVAPGVNIISTYMERSYNTATGTGVSASIVSGVLALLMQYIISEAKLGRLSLFTEVLKTYLMLGATKNSLYIYPNNSQGYGIINLENTIIQIANNI